MSAFDLVAHTERPDSASDGYFERCDCVFGSERAGLDSASDKSNFHFVRFPDFSLTDSDSVSGNVFEINIHLPVALQSAACRAGRTAL